MECCNFYCKTIIEYLNKIELDKVLNTLFLLTRRTNLKSLDWVVLSFAWSEAEVDFFITSLR